MTEPRIRTPTLADVISTGINSSLMDVHTALPGKVEKYDKDKQTVNVKPLVQRSFPNDDGETILEPLPIITDVPVMFPQANGFFISFPIVVGDFVLLVFAERSLDNYKTGNGADADPVDLRMHNLSDAVAYPGVPPFSKALKDVDAENMVMGKDGGKQIHIKQEEVHLGKKDPTDAVALASLVKAELDKIQFTLDNHAHPTTATVGPSATPGVISKTLTPVGSIAEIKSDVVKSE